MALLQLTTTNSKLKTWLRTKEIILHIEKDTFIAFLPHYGIYREIYVYKTYKTPNNVSKNLVFDLGSNIGIATKYFLDNKAKNVVCVEPSHQAIARLLYHCRDYLNVQIIHKAISDRIKTAHFKESASTITGCLTNKKGTSITTTTIDELSNIYGFPSIIKMDIEGEELNALRGADWTLSKAKPYLMIEVHNNLDERVNKKLAKYKYECIKTVKGVKHYESKQ